ncbi:hypothetical protein BGZ95_007227 [Linnemannia exigua]|uniref:Uncharacterized protein n=1 Tax=Linnemannia exigua TaxID=604196 RepID=A0AAD4HAR9_9FUNG|nr:hypothetical protein BGZ95_007227 [Linnemannia exigua]
MMQSVTISAPIPVPGTQQEPTTPSLGSTATSATIIHISGASNNSELHKNNSNGGSRITTIGTSTGVGGVGVNAAGNNSNSSNAIHRSSSGSNGGSSRDNSKDKGGNNPGLRRFPSIGNTKKLHIENSTLRSKIAELERYLQGLKEELILAHRQIHAKNLEAKISQERKAVEIHELGQHIQRCEFDLLAKTAECEALQNKLQYQTKESVSKLKHINMLETEIMDYRRMSIMSGHGPSGTTGAGAVGMSIGPGGMVARGGSVMFRNSRNSSDLTESVRSSTVLQDNAAAEEEAAAVGALQAQVKLLKDEHWKKDEQIQELSEKIQFLTDAVAQLEKAASASAAASVSLTTMDVTDDVVEDVIEDMTKTTSTTDKSIIVSESTSNASFNTAATGEVSSDDSSSSIVVKNSVGYNLSVEHPKLLTRYQALRSQHALASEYLGQLESENTDLKVQLLDVFLPSSTAASGVESLDVPTPTVENAEDISVSTEKKVEEVKKNEDEEQEEEAITPTDVASPIASAIAAAASAAAIIPSSSRNSLHHPAASGLTPLDTVAANTDDTTSSISSSCSATSSTGNDEELSPTSAVTSSSSPSTVTTAPALTRKSSLRYSRDGQVSPTNSATTAATGTTVAASTGTTAAASTTSATPLE